MTLQQITAKDLKHFTRPVLTYKGHNFYYSAGRFYIAGVYAYSCTSIHSTIKELKSELRRLTK